jgi:phosphate transport system substrate-binding protein
MNRSSKATSALFIVLALLLAVTAGPADAESTKKIRIIGSRYLYFSVTDFARVYSDKNPNTHVLVTSADYAEAFRAFLDKEADAFMAFRKLDNDEKAEAADAGLQLVEQPVGWGAVALIVNPQNPVKELTIEQVRKIFAGEITNWKQVGGQDEPIAPMTRDESVSGTELFFREAVLKGFPVAQQTIRVLDHDIVRAVRQENGAIADARFFEAIRGRIKGLVKVVAIKEREDAPAVTPSNETLQNRTYAISGPLYLYYGRNAAKEDTLKFVQFCLDRGIGARYSQVSK